MAEEVVIESFEMSTLNRTKTPLKQWKTHKGQSIKTGLHGVHKKKKCHYHGASHMICQPTTSWIIKYVNSVHQRTILHKQ